MHAVAAQVERTNAVVVADGIDSEAQRRRAMGMGADFGVGSLFPAVDSLGELADEPVAPFPPIPTWNHTAATVEATTDTPYLMLSPGRRTIRSRKRLLITMSTTLEAQAAASGPETVVLGTFQHARHFTETTAARWRSLADTVSYVGVYGVDMPEAINSGIYHAPLDPADPLVHEWTIVVLAPHFLQRALRTRPTPQQRRHGQRVRLRCVIRSRRGRAQRTSDHDPVLQPSRHRVNHTDGIRSAR